ncbi:MAG: hypothetical protein R2855_04730 [Thermomicrobiales bacterium]
MTASGATIADLIDNLDIAYPGIRDRIVENDGEIAVSANAVNGKQRAQKLDGAQTAIKRLHEVVTSAMAVVAVVPVVRLPAATRPTRTAEEYPRECGWNDRRRRTS